jgi:hypothetical protein
MNRVTIKWVAITTIIVAAVILWLFFAPEVDLMQ